MGEGPGRTQIERTLQKKAAGGANAEFQSSGNSVFWQVWPIDYILRRQGMFQVAQPRLACHKAVLCCRSATTFPQFKIGTSSTVYEAPFFFIPDIPKNPMEMAFSIRSSNFLGRLGLANSENSQSPDFASACLPRD
jgi:hypothetical protein